MRATRSAALAVGLCLAIQIGIPLRQLLRPRPARFGWQMFAIRPLPPVAIAIRDGGTRDTLPVDDYFVFRRGDLSPSSIDRLPAHLCRVIPELDAIVMHRHVGADSAVHRCR